MKSTLTLDDDDAMVAIAAAKAALAKFGKPGAVAVTDSHGELIAGVRQWGASLSTLSIATNKAFTATRLKRSTFELGRAVRHPETGFDLAYYGEPRFTGFGGGVPVIKDGVVLGAVAVSGLTQAEDDEIAKAAVAAILARP